jgi:ABC-type sugar transport system, periplasmic component
MSVTKHRVRVAAAVALSAGLAASLAACSRSQNDDPEGPITIVVQTFGNFGYEKAVEEWNATHDDIKIDFQPQGELRDFAPRLAQWLSAGAGAGDVVGLEEGQLLQYLQQPEYFVNLFDYGGEELRDDFVSWKFERGTTNNGTFLLGLGTDVGGMALCYRRDLFEAAGLPTDRDEVSELIPDWDAYMSVGEQFTAANTGAAWIDSATSIVQSYVMQQGDAFFYDENNNFIGDKNPTLRAAWDYGLEMATKGLTAKLGRWNSDWDAAFQNAAFATVPCPAWFAGGVIPPRAGDGAAGKWDVARMPGGGGNWGGSYLAVPAQTKHPREAYEVAKYLTGKEGQLFAWEEAGAMPSNTGALADPRFIDTTNEYLNNAPIGKIFAESVAGIEPMNLGPLHQQLWETVMEPAMQRAEQGGPSTYESEWEAWIKEAKDLVSQ